MAAIQSHAVGALTKFKVDNATKTAAAISSNDPATLERPRRSPANHLLSDNKVGNVDASGF
jgi:hypothetical protein